MPAEAKAQHPPSRLKPAALRQHPPARRHPAPAAPAAEARPLDDGTAGRRKLAAPTQPRGNQPELESAMSKGLDKKKETKKQPLKTPKEKKAEKAAKKAK
jgi:hypothetical protein